MRAICMVLAGAAAISVAAPASAQWGRDRTYSRQLQGEIDSGVSQGSISPRESATLHEKLYSLMQLERRFMPNGISGPEYSVLLQRSTALEKDIGSAIGARGSHDNKAVAWESGSSGGHWVPDARFAGLHPGDRFSGDARIGQQATARIVSMPARYRKDYVDTDRVYYGFDNGRVYQIDRQSRTILALLDIMR
jgi:hypothetical protein